MSIVEHLELIGASITGPVSIFGDGPRRATPPSREARPCILIRRILIHVQLEPPSRVRKRGRPRVRDVDLIRRSGSATDTCPRWVEYVTKIFNRIRDT
ncbi:hypothetical protein AVEN_219912-1 [Araneus ventricosus]|uniref:Uncharacterized protein n=1 Tax=Araneus ventricosus TaxID=182803 RepID=A0A4Y2SDV8_ARAVE|nr:hypothetical protein AVEN_113819-1 [Araneus ventricosus]GBN85465.1 hypothetical protein AVEN_219912-1 [Araneus ventricosus]